jgi:hypothetical protein
MYDAGDPGGSRMPARSILMAIALSAWLVIGILVFITVAYVGFIGVGVVGLVLLFVCTLVELDAGATAGGAGLVARGPAAVAAVDPLLQVSRRRARRGRHRWLPAVPGLGRHATGPGIRVGKPGGVVQSKISG